MWTFEPQRPTPWLCNELRTFSSCWAPGRHPFAKALRCGRLEDSALRAFAMQHELVLKAAAGLSVRAASASRGLLRDVLVAHSAQRASELALWRRLAAEAGWWPTAMTSSPGQLNGTAITCARLLREPHPLDASLVALLTFGCIERSVMTSITLSAALTSETREVVEALTVPIAQRLDTCGAAVEGLGSFTDPFGPLRLSRAIFCSYWAILDELALSSPRAPHPFAGGRTR